MKKRTKSSTKRKTATAKSRDEDIIKVLKTDHQPLKKLIKVMKETENSMGARRTALEEFGPLLLEHAKAEEKVLYTFLKEQADMEEEGFEGDVEHGLAEQMLEEAKSTNDEDLWSARVKVLAELVEHHLDEEENEIFPEFKKNSELEERKILAADYLEEKANVRSSEKPSRKQHSRETTAHFQ